MARFILMFLTACWNDRFATTVWSIPDDVSAVDLAPSFLLENHLPTLRNLLQSVEIRGFHGFHSYLSHAMVADTNSFR